MIDWFSILPHLILAGGGFCVFCAGAFLRPRSAGLLWAKMPVFSGFFLLFAMASLGLPGLNNFVGEILILIGAFREWPWAAGIAFAGLVFTVIFILGLLQGTLFGETGNNRINEQRIEDVTAREAAIHLPLAPAILFLGL